jgi:CRP-like cAMP-binding protein
MQERMELLSAMPVFGGLNEQTLELLTSLAQPVAVAKGEYFFREDDETHSMYVLSSGAIVIFKTWKGKSILLRRMRQGDCFGEMALMDLFPRSASVLAVENCEALEITPATLLEIFRLDTEQFALLQMNMGRELSRRLRKVDELLFRALMGDALPETTFEEMT